MPNSPRNSERRRSTLSKLTYLSLFSGIGGFECGIHTVLPNAKCVGYSEIDPYAIKTYQKHFPKHTNFGDITKIREHELPDFDLLVGGFPCQSFSIAGKRKGFADPRGQMFNHIARILRTKKPRYFLLENVKGLLNHANGRTFKTIISEIEKLGYAVEWEVHNSKHFGVPQHRERAYIVGHLGRKSRSKVFPLHEAHPHDVVPHQQKAGSGIQLLYNGGYANRKIVGIDGASPAVLASTIPLIAITNSSTREFKWMSAYSPALCAGDSKNNKLVGYACSKCNGQYCRIRKLTPLECERLQGFPDGHTSGISDSQRYKCCGNAVTTNVIAAIIAKMFFPARV